MFDALKVKNECVEWIRDFFEKNGKGCNAIVGISGGKDSSTVAALCVEALGGRPGVHSARYAPKGEECGKLLGEMEDVPDGKRGAAFRCTICYMDESGHAEFTGSCEGAIGYEQRGSNGFGYDPVFMVGDRTMAELSADEKNAISHRGAALRELYRFLKERNGD